MSETAQAYAWVIATAQADTALMAVATGGTWQGFADIGVVSPYFLVTQQSGSDVLTMSVKRLFTHLLVQIKMIGPTSAYAALVTGANRIDALFGRPNSVALPGGGGLLACWREQPLSYDELLNGSDFSHLGGLYHIELQGA